MSIISELRDLADDIRGCEILSLRKVDMLDDLIDRLAASGALVPVADGRTVQVFWLDGNDLLFLANGSLHIKGMDSVLSLGPDRFHNHIDDETIVQPVRLVPITEAEI